MLFSGLERYRDFGLFILRAGVGAMFVTHGFPKLEGGPELWAKVGGAMANIGIDFGHTAFGLAAALTECLGGIALILGLGTRVAALFLAFVMGIAATHHLSRGDGLAGASHAIELGVVFLALFVIGAGSYSVDAKLGK
ncbi:DoxX family protein [bacterium]|nr:DoxX family protein [bacterium]